MVDVILLCAAGVCLAFAGAKLITVVLDLLLCEIDSASFFKFFEDY